MDARVKELGDITVIEIIGSLSIERTQPFREACKRHLLGKKVVFNMEKASFVGSTGLQAFLDTVSAVDQASEHSVRIVSAKSEFKRLFQSLESKKIEFYENEVSAVTEWPIPSSVGLGEHSALD